MSGFPTSGAKIQVRRIARPITFLSARVRPRSQRFVLACMASLKGESNALSHNVALICAGMRFERDRGARSVSDNAWPGSQEAGSNGRQVHGGRRRESRANGAELASDEIQWH